MTSGDAFKARLHDQLGGGVFDAIPCPGGAQFIIAGKPFRLPIGTFTPIPTEPTVPGIYRTSAHMVFAVLAAPAASVPNDGHAWYVLYADIRRVSGWQNYGYLIDSDTLPVGDPIATFEQETP